MGVEAILEAKRCYQVHLPRSSAFAEWDCVSLSSTFLLPPGPLAGVQLSR